MKRISTFLLLTAFVLISGSAWAQKNYCVAFYNVENLFDTYHDEGKNDYEYLPEGRIGWNHEKYTAKLQNLETVLSQLGKDVVPEGPVAIGLAEVENFKVLQDLITQPKLRSENYQYVHYEGPDKRGIDCALIYNPKLFLPIATKLVPSVPFKGDTVHLTRGFLIVRGEVREANEELTIIVNHWPSRGADAPVRMHAAQQVKQITDSLYRDNAHAKIVIMGDLNDDPMDASVVEGLGAKKYISEVGKYGFFNPWWSTLEDDGIGTLKYRGKWNLFDQIIVSKSLLAKRGLRFVSNKVFNPDYLFQTDGKYAGYPLRTYGGKVWMNGYSDHFPTMIFLKK